MKTLKMYNYQNNKNYYVNDIQLFQEEAINVLNVMSLFARDEIKMKNERKS